MKWVRQEARYGDLVRVSLGPAIFHFGIYVSEDEVIQFGLPPRPGRDSASVTVLAAPMSAFCEGKPYEVGVSEEGDRGRRRSPEETVQEARAHLGERGYDIIHNNCEHFANACALGERFSSMTEGVRAKFRAVPLVHVYVSRFPFPAGSGEIFPPERREEIARCTNEEVRESKYYVWKLLEHALMRSLGLRAENLPFRREESGKWTAEGCFFSLSHSGHIAAAAVSRKPVGVDVELRDEARFTDAVARRIATERERGALFALSPEERGREANILWTKKEAIFKLGDGKAFLPAQTESGKFPTLTRTLCADGAQYFLTVASENARQAAFYPAEGVTLSEL